MIEVGAQDGAPYNLQDIDQPPKNQSAHHTQVQTHSITNSPDNDLLDLEQFPLSLQIIGHELVHLILAQRTLVTLVQSLQRHLGIVQPVK